MEFDVLSMNLNGSHLIEASAGTGKTYNITFIVVRLLLEKKMSIDEILVVTFTEAATGELREKIRNRLNETLQVLENGAGRDDTIVNYVNGIGDKKSAIHQLKIAVRDFDQASISTIHSFCQRVLKENAFESGVDFDVTLVKDPWPLFYDIAMDYWATITYFEDPFLVRFFQDNKVGPESLTRLVNLISSKPNLVFLLQDGKNAKEQFFTAYTELQSTWAETREHMAELLHSHPGVGRRSYTKRNVSRWMDQMDRYLAFPKPFRVVNPDTDGVFRFTNDALSNKCPAGQSPPHHPIFDACERLQTAQNELVSQISTIKKNLAAYGRIQLHQRKQEKGIQFFDDLLQQFERALLGEPELGTRLAHRVRSAYKAVLIDEFQDTDSIQYGIFSRIYENTEAPFFMIGDPKQSIYAFRGGDIFTYMAAAKSARYTSTLHTNWRSHKDLIGPVNVLFSRKQRPFFYDEIDYNPVEPRPGDHHQLLLDGVGISPFEFLFVPRTKTNVYHGKLRNGDDFYLDGMAGEMADMLNSRFQLEPGRLAQPKDVAVLVRSNNQGLRVQAALKKRGIASVVAGEQSVYESQAADEIYRVLLAVCEPGHSGKLKGALCTRIFGNTGEQIAQLENDDSLWQWWCNLFDDFQSRWHKKGFIQMVQSIVDFSHPQDSRRLKGRILPLENGERYLTDFWHVCELLQKQQTECHMGIHEVMRFFEFARANPQHKQEDEQIRLESDDDAVTIVTIHKSKGLQYPIVYLPFLWAGVHRSDNEEPIVFHDPTDGYIEKWDLGSDNLEQSARYANEEELAENFRILYVALTRAQFACKIIWGAFNRFESSAMGRLLHSEIVQETPQKLRNTIGKWEDEQLLISLKEFQLACGGATAVRPLEMSDGVYEPQVYKQETSLTIRTVNMPIPPAWRLSSFSSITATEHQTLAFKGDDETEHDTFPHLLSEPDAAFQSVQYLSPIDMGDFPRGTAAGTCLHEILEDMAFENMGGDSFSVLVCDKLERYGFSSEQWSTKVQNWIRDILRTPLLDVNTASRGHERRAIGDESENTTSPVERQLLLFDGNSSNPGDNLTLERIPSTKCIKELEFMLPVWGRHPISKQSLLSAMDVEAKGSYANYLHFAEELEIGTLSGFFKGFIDLVFEHDGKWYVVDYKSNYLGEHLADYNSKGIAAAMAEHHYYLQYHLYTAALDRFLKCHIADYDYDIHFGNVLYLFLRGMGRLDRSIGVFRDRPPKKRIDALQALFKSPTDTWEDNE